MTGYYPAQLHTWPPPVCLPMSLLLYRIVRVVFGIPWTVDRYKLHRHFGDYQSSGVFQTSCLLKCLVKCILFKYSILTCHIINWLCVYFPLFTRYVFQRFQTTSLCSSYRVKYMLWLYQVWLSYICMPSSNRQGNHWADCNRCTFRRHLPGHGINTYSLQQLSACILHVY